MSEHTSIGATGSPAAPAKPALLAEAFVALADKLVDDFDVVELLDRLAQSCIDLLGATATGLMITDQRGGLQVIASSGEAVHLLELFQIQSDEGPCRDCVRSGDVVTSPDLSADARWPNFAPAARSAGFTAVQALPLRLRSDTIGALNLFFDKSRPILAEADQRIAQALADVATIGVLQERAIHRSAVVAEQLQRALNSRVVIEQAKGMIAQELQLDMDDSFALLRRYARDHNRKLSDVATAISDGQLLPRALLSE